MFGLLVLQVQYPASVGGALGTVSLAGVKVSVKDLPLAALLDPTWLLTLLVGLKYCQTALAVERQYPYLHRLEEAIAARLGDPELFCREGKAYLRAYPTVLNWAWFCYVILFPLAALAGACLLTVVIWRDLDYGGWAQGFRHGNGGGTRCFLRPVPSHPASWTCGELASRAQVADVDRCRWLDVTTPRASPLSGDREGARGHPVPTRRSALHAKGSQPTSTRRPSKAFLQPPASRRSPEL